MNLTANSGVNSAPIQPALFEPVIQTSNCAECGSLFVPIQKSQRFCKKDCRSRHYNKKQDLKLRERQSLIQVFSAPSRLSRRQSENPKNAEAIALYTENRLGIKSIGKLQGRNHSYIRKLLVSAGVYRPNPKFNGKAKEGHGIGSRKPCDQELIRRQQVKLARDLERVKASRAKMAAILRGLRHGIPSERTRFENNWSNGVMQQLVKRPSYIKRFAKPKPTHRKPLVHKANHTYSRQYRKEVQFQDAIWSTISDSASREHKTGEYASRADFVWNGYAIEVKTETTTQAILVGIGQLNLYKLNGFKPMLLIPNDVEIRPDLVAVIEAIPAVICTEAAFKNLTAPSTALQPAGDHAPIQRLGIEILNVVPPL